MHKVISEIRSSANRFSENLRNKVEDRVCEMEFDDKSHFLIYKVLGVTKREGEMIDIYQNKGRFLYQYAGAFLEEATRICFLYNFPESKKVKIENTIGAKPKKFEIDCLEGNNAIEIKWRDATTDGDHVTKEHTRIQAIHSLGLKPIRIMFYYPNRAQAIRIQDALATLYRGMGGEYYYGNSAWEYVQKRTGINLLQILEDIAAERTGEK